MEMRESLAKKVAWISVISNIILTSRENLSSVCMEIVMLCLQMGFTLRQMYLHLSSYC